MNRFFMLAMILVGFNLIACRSEGVVVDISPIGRWHSSEGFEVTVYKDGKYKFCDNGQCLDGTYERPFGDKSYAIILKNLFEYKLSNRFKSRLNEVGYFEYSGNIKSRDIDFSINDGISGFHTSNKQCEVRGCVAFGSVEDGNHILFVKG